MKFRYKAGDGPQKTVIYGYTFYDGQSTEVPDDVMIDYGKKGQVSVIQKLKGQPNLSQVKQRKAKA